MKHRTRNKTTCSIRRSIKTHPGLTDFWIGLLCFSVSLYKLLLQWLKLLKTGKEYQSLTREICFQPHYNSSSRKFKDFHRNSSNFEGKMKFKDELKLKDFSRLCEPCEREPGTPNLCNPWCPAYDFYEKASISKLPKSKRKVPVPSTGWY